MATKPELHQRVAPQIPPKDQRIRLLIDTDAKAEIDDQYALALAIYSPERFAIEGFVGVNFEGPGGGKGSCQRSVEEIELILAKAGMSGKWPVKQGSDPMQYQFVPSESKGVDFIIERAMSGTPEEPLWIVGLGACTDIASAYLREPRIADRVVVFWHGRTRWPEKCYNFNVFGDVRATRILFHSPMPLVLFDTGTHLTAELTETEKHLKPYGQLGRYLHEYRMTNPGFMSPDKGFFDLGDIAALLDPDIACWEITECPEVDWDLDYEFKGTMGSILRCFHVDRDKAFSLLYNKVKQYNS